MPDRNIFLCLVLCPLHLMSCVCVPVRNSFLYLMFCVCYPDRNIFLCFMSCVCVPDRNIFPDNLLQAAFQHTKTVYKNAGYIMPDGDLPENVSNAINVTLLTTTQTTLLTTVNDTNATYIIVKEKEIRWVRTFPMADGINVLGKG